MTGVDDKLNNKKINGVVLEMIMRDVLHGMHDFTADVCSNSEAGKIDIIAVEEAVNTVPEKARVIPFPGTRKKSG